MTSKFHGVPASAFNSPQPGQPLIGVFRDALMGEGKKVRIDFVKTSSDSSATVVVTTWPWTLAQ